MLAPIDKLRRIAPEGKLYEVDQYIVRVFGVGVKRASREDLIEIAQVPQLQRKAFLRRLQDLGWKRHSDGKARWWIAPENWND